MYSLLYQGFSVKKIQGLLQHFCCCPTLSKATPFYPFHTTALVFTTTVPCFLCYYHTANDNTATPLISEPCGVRAQALQERIPFFSLFLSIHLPQAPYWGTLLQNDFLAQQILFKPESCPFQMNATLNRTYAMLSMHLSLALDRLPLYLLFVESHLHNKLAQVRILLKDRLINWVPTIFMVFCELGKTCKIHLVIYGQRKDPILSKLGISTATNFTTNKKTFVFSWARTIQSSMM